MVGPAGRALLDARARFVVPRTAPIAHEDHVLARDAILEALPTLGVGSLLLYEELPYLWGAPADESVRLLSQQTRLPARGFSLPVDRAEKARRIGGYTSQLRYMHSPSGPLDRAQSLPPQERYWLLTQALEAPFDS